MAEKSVFDVLNDINCNGHVKQKKNLSYLPWAWAWAEVKKKYPNAQYTIYERETEYGLVNYFTDGRTCWVKTGVTIEGLEHIEELPVMDYRNAAISYDKVTSFDVNKTIQRSLTKAAARHGLGLYIYAGEDLPEDEPTPQPTKKMQKPKPEQTKDPQQVMAGLVADFAHAKGKTPQDVCAALNQTKTLQGMGVTAATSEYTTEQQLAAIAILNQWLGN